MNIYKNHPDPQDIDDREQQWHLDKKVPLSLIIVVALQGVAGLWVIADIKKDVEVLKSHQAMQIERDSRQDRASGEAVALVREDIKEVKTMISRLIDREDRSRAGK